MPIRIWHQSFTVLQDLGPYADALREQVARVTRPDTEVVLHGMREGTYPTNYPGTDIRYAAGQYVHGLQFLAGAVQAEREGYDAYAICTLPEPALAEARSLVNIPVVGYFESALHTASFLGQRVGVLLFIEEMIPLMARNAARHGFAERMGAVRHVGFGFQDVLKAFSDPEPLLERFRTAARGLIAEGVDVIIPGEAPLCTLLSRHGVSRVDDVPVVDSFGATLMTAELHVEMKRRLGLSATGRGYYNARPDPERTAQWLDFYGALPAPPAGKA